MTLEKEQKLLITNTFNNTVSLIDVYGNFVSAKTLSNITTPYVITKNKDASLFFIIDYDSQNLFIFDSNFVYKKDIELPYLASFISFDDDNKTLYCSFYNDDLVGVVDCENDSLVYSFEIEKPGEIRFSNDKVLLVGAIKFNFDEETRTADVESGFNAILIYNKSSLELETILQIENWFSPLGLLITENMQIMTTAREQEDNEEKTISSSRYLFVMTFDGELIKKVELGDSKFLIDMVFMNNKLIFCQVDNHIRIIEFK